MSTEVSRAFNELGRRFDGVSAAARKKDAQYPALIDELRDCLAEGGQLLRTAMDAGLVLRPDATPPWIRLIEGSNFPPISIVRMPDGTVQSTKKSPREVIGTILGFQQVLEGRDPEKQSALARRHRVPKHVWANRDWCLDRYRFLEALETWLAERYTELRSLGLSEIELEPSDGGETIRLVTDWEDDSTRGHLVPTIARMAAKACRCLARETCRSSGSSDRPRRGMLAGSLLRPHQRAIARALSSAGVDPTLTAGDAVRGSGAAFEDALRSIDPNFDDEGATASCEQDEAEPTRPPESLELAPDVEVTQQLPDAVDESLLKAMSPSGANWTISTAGLLDGRHGGTDRTIHRRLRLMIQWRWIDRPKRGRYQRTATGDSMLEVAKARRRMMRK